MSRARRLLAITVAALLAACSAPGGPPALAVGATADPQIVLLANVYAAGLRYYGTAARVEPVSDVFEALGDGTVGLAPGFTGRLLARLDPESEARSAAQVYRVMAGGLPEGIAAADYAVAAEDKPALAVTGATATAWGSRDLTAVVRNCRRVSVGARTGAQTPDSVGECALPPPAEFGTAAMLFDALQAGVVTAAWTTTADTGNPRDVVVLVDRTPTLLPAENVVALFRRNELNAMQLRAVNEIAGVLDTASLVGMLREVEDGADPRVVAEDWLAANPLGR